MNKLAWLTLWVGLKSIKQGGNMEQISWRKTWNWKRYMHVQNKPIIKSITSKNKRPMCRNLLTWVKPITYLQKPCNFLPVLPQQLRHNLDRTIKRSKVILGSSFEHIESRYNKPRFSLKAFLVLEKNVFYHIWVWLPFCSVVKNHWINCQYPSDRRPHAKSSENWSSGFREDYKILYKYVAQEQRQTTSEWHNFDFN